MSTSNLYNAGTKTWKKIHVNEVTCDTLTATTMIGNLVDPHLEANTIGTYDSGNTTMLAPLIVSQHIATDLIEDNGAGFTTVTNVRAGTLAGSGGGALPINSDVQVNVIEDNGAGFTTVTNVRAATLQSIAGALEVGSDIDMNSNNLLGTGDVTSEKILVTDDPTITPSDNLAKVHVTSLTNAIVYVEADTDVIGGGDPSYQMTKDGGAYSVGTNGDNNLEILTATSSGTSGFSFNIGTLLAKAKGALPSIVAPFFEPFRILGTVISAFVPLNMNGNNITDVDTITGSGINPLSIGSDVNMSNKDILNAKDIYVKCMLKNAGAPNIEVGDSLDLLNNDLLGVDNITTTSATVNGSIDLTQGNLNNVLAINNTSASISVNPLSNFIIADTKNLSMSNAWIVMSDPSGLTPGTPGANQGFIYKVGKDIYFKTLTATYNITDPFYNKGTVTQTGSGSIAVTINNKSGTITCFNTALAPFAFVDFQVNNTQCLSTSIVLANLSDYAGTTGLPTFGVDDIAAGSFRIRLYNAHGTLSLNGVCKVNFIIY